MAVKAWLEGKRRFGVIVDQHCWLQTEEEEKKGKACSEVARKKDCGAESRDFECRD